MNSEFDFQTGKPQAIDPLRIILIGWSRILGEYGKKFFTYRFWNFIEPFFRAADRQMVIFMRAAEAFGSLRVAVRIRNIGLNIKNRCVVH